MSQDRRQLRKKIEQEETLRLWEELERAVRQDSKLPDSQGLPLRRFRTTLEDITSISLGALLGIFVLLFNFLVFTCLLHIGN